MKNLANRIAHDGMNPLPSHYIGPYDRACIQIGQNRTIKVEYALQETISSMTHVLDGDRDWIDNIFWDWYKNEID